MAKFNRVFCRFPMQLSFSFEFFVHGESTVCMSVDVRQHPAIRRVGRTHISVSQNQAIPGTVLVVLSTL